MSDTPVIDRRGITAADGSTKARLERAALSLFIDQGVDAATTRAIAAGAGVAEGTLYRHMTGKDEFAEDMFFAIHSHLANLVDDAATNAGTVLFAEMIGQIVGALCVYADDDPAAFTFHLLYTHHYLPRRPHARNPVDIVEHLIDAAKQRGDLSSAELPQGISDGDAHKSAATPFLAALALGPVMQTALHRIYGRLPGLMQDYAPALTVSICATLGVSTSRQEKQR